MFILDNTNLHTLAVVLYELSDNTTECFEPFTVGIINQNCAFLDLENSSNCGKSFNS
jgi:hypothetical protein